MILDGGSGVTATVDSTGITNVSINGLTALFGSLTAESSGSRFGINDLTFGAITSKFVVGLTPTSARVTQIYERGTVVLVVSISGEDLTITATVTPTVFCTVLGLTGLLCNWTIDEHQTGMLGGFAVNILDSSLRFFHPSELNQIGATYRVPGARGFGVSAFPVGCGLQRTLMYCYQLQDGGGTWHPSIEWFLVPSTHRYPGTVPPPTTSLAGGLSANLFSYGIHAHETYTCQIGLRVSTDTSWQHLLAPYKTQFNAAFGSCAYAAARDDRPICISFPGSPSTISPTNPYGYLEGGPNQYRFDLGVTAWCDLYISPMTNAGCQGVIFWTPSGWDTRFAGIDGGGVNYTPDVHTLPPETAANWPTMMTRLSAASLKCGRESRTGIVRTRGPWVGDYPYAVAAERPEHLSDLVTRFVNAAAFGFTFFYCDSFPSDFNEHLVLKTLRSQWGATSPLTYTESFSDVSLVYSGVYTEISGGSPYLPNSPLTSDGTPLLTIARWITPHTSVAALDRTSSNFSTAYLDWLYQHQITPLVSDQDLDVFHLTLPALLAGYNATYLTANQFASS